MKAIIVAAAIGLLAGCAGMSPSGGSSSGSSASGSMGAGSAWDQELKKQEFYFNSYAN
jgi:hypothetical protein